MMTGCFDFAVADSRCKRLGIFWVAIVFILLQFACNKGYRSELQVFRYNESAGISSLDPAFARSQSVIWPVMQIFNTLLELDSNLNIQPSLAKSWITSTDRRKYIFELRTDVFFHDDPCFPGGKGRKLRSADVLYSLTRLMDPQTASPGAWVLNGRLDADSPFVIQNDSLFEIRLREPFPAFAGILTMAYCSVLAPEAIQYYGSRFNRHPVGTGPFSFLAWHDREGLLLRKNPHYFEKDQQGNALPYLDRIHISFLESKLTEYLQFKQHKLDFINDLDASVKDEMITRNGALRANWKGVVNLHRAPYLNVEYLGFSMLDTHGMYRDQNLREAVAYSIDREKMLRYLRNGLGRPAHQGFIPVGMPGFQADFEGYRYNPAKADSLLQEYLKTHQGQKPRLTLMTVPNYASLGSFIVQSLTEAGIEARLDIVPKTVLLDQMAAGEVSFFRGSWIADYPDPENYLSVFVGTNPAPPNYTRYKNQLYDSLYKMALAEPEAGIRYGLYQRMDSLIMSSLPVIPLWYDELLHLVHKDIRQWVPNAMNQLSLKRVYKSSP